VGGNSHIRSLALRSSKAPSPPRTDPNPAVTTRTDSKPAVKERTESKPTFAPCADPAACAEANKLAYARVVIGPQVDRSPAAQAKREKQIHKLIARRIFKKTGTQSNLPRVWVGPAFHGLNFEDKQRVVRVVAAYHHDAMRDMVLVLDGRTNKAIGTFTASGLKLD
jgi:hypothetical protein